MIAPDQAKGDTGCGVKLGKRGTKAIGGTCNDDIHNPHRRLAVTMRPAHSCIWRRVLNRL